MRLKKRVDVLETSVGILRGQRDRHQERNDTRTIRDLEERVKCLEDPHREVVKKIERAARRGINGVATMYGTTTPQALRRLYDLLTKHFEVHPELLEDEDE